MLSTLEVQQTLPQAQLHGSRLYLELLGITVEGFRPDHIFSYFGGPGIPQRTAVGSAGFQGLQGFGVECLVSRGTVHRDLKHQRTAEKVVGTLRTHLAFEP